MRRPAVAIIAMLVVVLGIIACNPSGQKPPAPVPPPPPVVVAGPTVTYFQNIETLADWTQPGNVGDSGGGSTAPHGSFIMTPGSPATFSASGAIPYDNGYFFTKLDTTGKFSNATKFEYDMEIMANAGDLAASQAIEFELELHVNGTVFNMAYQMRLINNNWYLFNYQNKSWVSTGIAVDRSAFTGQFGKISTVFTKNADGTVTHVSITLNGVEHTVNVTTPSVPNVYPGANGLNAALQLDSNGATPPTPYSIQVRNMTVVVTQ